MGAGWGKSNERSILFQSELAEEAEDGEEEQLAQAFTQWPFITLSAFPY